MSLNKKEVCAQFVRKSLSALEIASLVFQVSCVRPAPTVSPTPKISLLPAGLVTPPAGTETAPAVVELLEERRDLFSEIITEAIEEAGLVNAIKEGQASYAISKKEVAKILGE